MRRGPFTTHRCQAMPDGFSIRLYADDGVPYPWPEPGGWVLGACRYDGEYDYKYLDYVTPWKKEHIRFCPWCGKRLEEV